MCQSGRDDVSRTRQQSSYSRASQAARAPSHCSALSLERGHSCLPASSRPQGLGLSPPQLSWELRVSCGFPTEPKPPSRLLMTYLRFYDFVPVSSRAGLSSSFHALCAQDRGLIRQPVEGFGDPDVSTLKSERLWKGKWSCHSRLGLS